MGRWAHAKYKQRTWSGQEGLSFGAVAIMSCVKDYLKLITHVRYVEKFYSMRTQLQAISLRIQVGLILLLKAAPSTNLCLDRTNK